MSKLIQGNSVYGPTSGSVTDNAIARWDGTSGTFLQNSAFTISDTGDMVGGNVTWSSSGDFINSSASLSMSTAGGDLNFTSSANINFVAFTGAVNLVSDQDCTFGSVSGAFLLTANTSSNFTVSSGDLTLESTLGSLFLTGRSAIDLSCTSGTINFLSNTTHGANTAFFGTSNTVSMNYNGTAFLITPGTAGGATLGGVCIGTSTASGGNDQHLRVNKLAVGTSDLLGTSAINCVVTGSLRSALNFVLTMTSGTVAAPFQANIIDQSSGNNFVMANTLEYTLNSTSHESTAGFDAVKASVLNISTGINSAITLSPTNTTNYYMACLKLNGTGKGVGGAHSANVTIQACALYQKKMTVFTGSGTYIQTGGYFGNDLCIESESKLFFNSSAVDATTQVAVTKGAYWMQYTAGTTSIDTYTNNNLLLTVGQTNTGVRAGTSSTYAKVGGVIKVDTSTASNGTTVETDLHTFSIPANTLAVNGDSVTYEGGGVYATNANTKRIKIKYGATTMYDTTALAINAAGSVWSYRLRIVRTGAATQNYYGEFYTNNGTLTDMNASFNGTAAETLSGAVTIKVTGQSNTASTDITQNNSVVQWNSVQ